MKTTSGSLSLLSATNRWCCRESNRVNDTARSRQWAPPCSLKGDNLNLATH